MEIRIRKEWDIVDVNNNVEEWEMTAAFEVENIQGYAIEGDFKAFKTVRRQTRYEYPIIISIGAFNVFKCDELVIDYPISLIEEVKQLIKEEVR
jgi:hypothetical protein